MGRTRFLQLWILWSGLYLVLAVVGPNGLVPTPLWPVVSQHMLQVRSWLGEDIRAPQANGADDRVIPVQPRLDVTPYFRNRVVRDPREEMLVANLAVAIREPGGRATPVQSVWSGSFDLLASENLMCHVGFPLGPAFFLLPLFTILRGLLATQWLGAVLGGLAVAVMDRLMSDWTHAFGMGDGAPNSNFLTLLAGAGTLWLWIASDGGTFLFAQVVGTTMLAVALMASWRGRRWTAGAAFGFAICSRPAMLGALPILLALSMMEGSMGLSDLDGREEKSFFPRFMVRGTPILVGPLLLGSISLILNKLRFGSVFEFGYSFMIIPPFLRERLASHGQLSLAHLTRNLQYVGIQPPELIRDENGIFGFPFLASDPQGMGLLFVTPAFLALTAALWAMGRHQQRVLAAAWVSLVLVCLPGLLYYNTGWVQWGGRFLIDAWPLWMLLAAIGLRRLPKRISMILIALSVLSNAWAAFLTALRVWPGCCM